MERNPDGLAATTPYYWEARLKGQNSKLYTRVLETLTTGGALQSTFRSFLVTIPEVVTTVLLTFTWSQVCTVKASDGLNISLWKCVH